MKAIFLIKNGKSDKAFELRETEMPTYNDEQVLIKVEAFGLNYADVMARLGLYPACPPLPAILGYDVVGHIEAIGSKVTDFKVGDRVTAMTLFSGYAEYAAAEVSGMAKISDDMEVGIATALTTQYCTAYYCAEEMVHLHKGDKVLIHAAAGGVGQALVQLAKYRGCEIFGTVGSEDKMEYLKSIGVEHPINYRSEDFVAKIKEISGEKTLDVIFDPIGGKTFKDGYNQLNSGGKIVTFGASSMTQANNIFKKLMGVRAFGKYHPFSMLGPSRSILGVNMLPLAKKRPDILKRVLTEVVKMTEAGVLAPVVAKKFNVADIAEAHQFMEDRKTIGKVVVSW